MPIALTSSAAAASAAALSALLPQVRSFAQFAQVCHWRVTGNLFGILHPMLGELYAALVTYADEVAERIAQLQADVPPHVSMPVALAPTDGAAIARDCGKLGQQFGSRAYEAMRALDGNDRVFLAKLEELQGTIEKIVWQIEQHG